MWRALFESFAPVERALAPVFRFLIHPRAATLRGDAAPGSSDVRTMAFQTASSTLNLGASPEELGSLLRAYVGDVPESAALILGQRGELFGPSGRSEPIGVIAGMAFAMVTRASYGARLKRFQALGWRKASRMLRGLMPSTKKAESPLKGRIGFGDLEDTGAFVRLRGLVPVQPDDKSRVWGVNSFAASPAFGGAFNKDVAQQSGYPMPASSRQEKGTHSGLRLAAVDPDAPVTAPGVASYEKDEA